MTGPLNSRKRAVLMRASFLSADRSKRWSHTPPLSPMSCRGVEVRRADAFPAPATARALRPHPALPEIRPAALSAERVSGTKGARGTMSAVGTALVIRNGPFMLKQVDEFLLARVGLGVCLEQAIRLGPEVQRVVTNCRRFDEIHRIYYQG